jgi:hypothetical protein
MQQQACHIQTSTFSQSSRGRRRSGAEALPAEGCTPSGGIVSSCLQEEEEFSNLLTFHNTKMSIGTEYLHHITNTP